MSSPTKPWWRKGLLSWWLCSVRVWCKGLRVRVQYLLGFGVLGGGLRSRKKKPCKHFGSWFCSSLRLGRESTGAREHRQVDRMLRSNLEQEGQTEARVDALSMASSPSHLKRLPVLDASGYLNRQSLLLHNIKHKRFRDYGSLCSKGFHRATGTNPRAYGVSRFSFCGPVAIWLSTSNLQQGNP